MEETTAKGAEFVADSELEEPGTLIQKRRVTAAAKVHGRYDNVGQFPEHSETKQRCKMCHSYIHISVSVIYLSPKTRTVFSISH